MIYQQKPLLTGEVRNEARSILRWEKKSDT